MKILQIVHSFPPYNNAGTELYSYHLSKELAKRHDVFIFHRICDLKKKEYSLEYREAEGLKVFTINNTFRYCDSFRMFYENSLIASQFNKVLNKVKPDLVHIQHLIFLSTSLINEIKRKGIPIIFTLHDYWLICPQWHFLKKDFSICDDNNLWQCIECLDYQLHIKRLPKKIYCTLRNVMPNLLINFFKKIYLNLAKINVNTQEAFEKISERKKTIKELCAKVDLFIAPSKFLKKRFIEFAVPEDKIKLISHGIETNFSEGFEKKEADKIRFGFIGTMLPAKGLHILIDSFNMVKDNRAELNIYGKLQTYPGFEYYPRLLRKICKNKNIYFKGEFQNAHLAEVFSGIDVLVFPSLWYENCPLTILEAFAYKTPVIASRIGSIPEFVRDRENGLLFEPGNINNLFHQLNLVSSNPNLLEELKKDIVTPKNIRENAKELEQEYFLLKR